MQPTRRDFVRLGLGSSTLLACGATVPAFLARSAALLAAEATKRENVLVVVELSGGNDGLNTVVPFKDDDYRKHRPRLNLAAAKGLHKIDDGVALHPSLTGFAKLLEDRQLAVVQSVGYPNPNRSHFESMAIWQSARLKPSGHTPGWLARCLDITPSRGSEKTAAKTAADAPALHISEALLPQALAGSQRHVPSLANPEQFRRRLGMPDGPGAAAQRAALDRLSSADESDPGSLLQYVQRSTLVTYASSARLEAVLAGRSSGAAGYPEYFALAQRLRLIAELIKAGLTTSLYYTQIGGFDTHANQLGHHAVLLQELGSSLLAFVADLTKAGDGKRVLVLVFSEFGRRLGENASGGTDHGTAAPVFLLGGGVKAGVCGPYPNLQDLDAGRDPKHAIDFRQVYATILDQWLGCRSNAVLGGRFAPVSVLASTGG